MAWNAAILIPEHLEPVKNFILDIPKFDIFCPAGPNFAHFYAWFHCVLTAGLPQPIPGSGADLHFKNVCLVIAHAGLILSEGVAMLRFTGAPIQSYQKVQRAQKLPVINWLKRLCLYESIEAMNVASQNGHLRTVAQGV